MIKYKPLERIAEGLELAIENYDIEMWNKLHEKYTGCYEQMCQVLNQHHLYGGAIDTMKLKYVNRLCVLKERWEKK
jgi:replication initiation and membrane attachment protein DnaB